MWGLGFKVWRLGCLELMVKGKGFRFKVKGLEFGVECLRFRV